MPPLWNEFVGVGLGAMASLVVGTVLYAVRRAWANYDKTSLHGAKLAAIEVRLGAVEKGVERIERRLDHTNPGLV